VVAGRRDHCSDVSENPTTPGRSHLEQAGFDALLECERDETSQRLAGLVRQLDAIVEQCALSVSDDEHDPEGATLGFERAQVSALVGEARQHLEEIDRARERLRAGTYGVCEACGRPVGNERMKALVIARTCVACASGAAGGARRISSRGSG